MYLKFGWALPWVPAQFVFFARKETHHLLKETHGRLLIYHKRRMSIWVQGHFLQMSPIIDGFFLGTQRDPPSTKRNPCATHHIQHEMNALQHTATHCNTLQHEMDACMGTGWRRPIGCLKLQVYFRKTAIFYRALLQEMTYIDKASTGSSPPYN